MVMKQKLSTLFAPALLSMSLFFNGHAFGAAGAPALQEKSSPTTTHQQLVDVCYDGQEPADDRIDTGLSLYLARHSVPLKSFSINVAGQSREEMLELVSSLPDRINGVFDFYEEAYAYLIGSEGSQIHNLADSAYLSGADFEAFLGAIKDHPIVQCLNGMQVAYALEAHKAKISHFDPNRRHALEVLEERLPNIVFLDYAAAMAKLLENRFKYEEYSTLRDAALEKMQQDIAHPPFVPPFHHDMR